MATTESDLRPTGYRVIEDNGGGLHIFARHDDTIIWGGHNFEYLSSADFIATLEYLESDEAALREISRWDSLYTDPATEYAAMMQSEYGYCTIATYRRETKRTIYPDRMGSAGQRAFGIDAD